MKKPKNSFDFIRLLFASFVIFTHAVYLSGNGDADWLSKWTNGQINFSYLGVRGFFVISGFLVFGSLQRSDTAFQYLKKRFLRIFPALILMLLVTIEFAGFFLTKLSVKTYFSSPQISQFIIDNLHLTPICRTLTLPRVFENNPATTSVNGSLWTVWYELKFYLLLLIFFPIRNKNKILKKIFSQYS